MGTVYKPTYRDRHGSKVESRVWWIAYYRHGKQIRESAKTGSKREAGNMLKRNEGEVVSGMSVGPERIKIGGLLDLVV